MEPIDPSFDETSVQIGATIKARAPFMHSRLPQRYIKKSVQH